MGWATLSLRGLLASVALIAVLNGAAIATGRREYCIPATMAGLGIAIIAFGSRMRLEENWRRGMWQGLVVLSGAGLIALALLTVLFMFIARWVASV